jgi:hypothetical protein
MRRPLSLLFFWTLLSTTPAWGHLVHNDGPGNIRYLNLGGQRVFISTQIRMPRQGWGITASSRDAWKITEHSFSQTEDARHWTGRASEGDVSFRFEQTLREEDGVVHFAMKVTSLTNAPLEGVFCYIHLPIREFSGGLCHLFEEGRLNGSTQLPPVLPPNQRLLHARADSATAVDGAGDLRLDITLDRLLPGAVQDDRAWGSNVYTVYFQFHGGPLPSGQTTSMEASFRLTGRPDHQPARVQIDSSPLPDIYAGWGGNFVYGVDCPETEFLLESLRVSWARTGMSLKEWEPVNDNDDPDTINWPAFSKRVWPGSSLDREFRLARRLRDKGIPLITSVWGLPQWLQNSPGTAVPRSSWPELCESILSYLLFARDQYGVEFDLFSFNEPDYGVDVKFSPEEHRDIIKLLGAKFSQSGLETRLLLADITNPALDPAYALPVIEDPEAFSQVSAVAVHSWSWDDYETWGAGMEAWAVLARSVGLPFLVTEVGADASAWHYSWLFQSFGYALDDLRNYLSVLYFGRPLAALQWELTCDYPLISRQGGQMVPNKRFFMVRHLSDIVPSGSSYLGVQSDHPEVVPVGFRWGSEQRARYVVHIGNLGARRSVTVSGLPSDLVSLGAVITSETDSFQAWPVIPVRDGQVTLQLPAQSLVTLHGWSTGRRRR